MYGLARIIDLWGVKVGSTSSEAVCNVNDGGEQSVHSVARMNEGVTTQMQGCLVCSATSCDHPGAEHGITSSVPVK